MADQSPRSGRSPPQRSLLRVESRDVDVEDLGSLPRLIKVDSSPREAHSNSGGDDMSPPRALFLGGMDGLGSNEECKAGGIPMRTPHLSRNWTEREVLERILGMTLEQKKRARALPKLGIGEDDLKQAERIFLEAAAYCSISRKEERVLGYSREQMKRERALDRLGVTEEEIEMGAAKSLAALGVQPAPLSARKKSQGFIRSSSAVIDTSLGDSSSSNTAPPDSARGPSESGLVLGNIRSYIDKKRRSLTPVMSASAELHSTGGGEGSSPAPSVLPPSSLSYAELYDMYLSEKRRGDQLERELLEAARSVSPRGTDFFANPLLELRPPDRPPLPLEAADKLGVGAESGGAGLVLQAVRSSPRTMNNMAAVSTMSGSL